MYSLLLLFHLFIPCYFWEKLIVPPFILPEDAAIPDRSTLDRMSKATRHFESIYGAQSQTSPQKRPIPPVPSLRGWLLNSVSRGSIGTILTAHYNPSFSSYLIGQVGLWSPSQLATFTLTITIDSVVYSHTFLNPTPALLESTFIQIGLKAWGGNPLQTSSPGLPTVLGNVDHYFWLVSVPHPSVTFSLTFSDGNSTDRTLVGSVVRDTPDGNLIDAFDAMDLEWPLTPGSKVILSQFPDGWGIIAAKQRMLFNS